jgi:hypothetical protein
MIIPFGKYRGLDLQDLPDEYLEWLFTIELREPLRSAVEDEIAARRKPVGAGHRIADELVTAGYRVMAMRYHPDKGGDTQTMQLVNQAASWLRGQLRGLPQ